MWLFAGALVGGVVALGSGRGFDWPAIGGGSLFLTLVSFGLILPFLLLSFACPFYRERLKSLLRLPAPEVRETTAISPPVTDGETA